MMLEFFIFPSSEAYTKKGVQCKSLAPCFFHWRWWFAVNCSCRWRLDSLKMKSILIKSCSSKTFCYPQSNSQIKVRFAHIVMIMWKTKLRFRLLYIFGMTFQFERPNCSRSQTIHSEGDIYPYMLLKVVWVYERSLTVHVANPHFGKSILCVGH